MGVVYGKDCSVGDCCPRFPLYYLAFIPMAYGTIANANHGELSGLVEDILKAYSPLPSLVCQVYAAPEAC